MAIDPSVSPMPPWNARGMSASGIWAARPTNSDCDREREECRHTCPRDEQDDEGDADGGDEEKGGWIRGRHRARAYLSCQLGSTSRPHYSMRVGPHPHALSLGGAAHAALHSVASLGRRRQ